MLGLPLHRRTCPDSGGMEREAFFCIAKNTQRVRKETESYRCKCGNTFISCNYQIRMVHGPTVTLIHANTFGRPLISNPPLRAFRV